jgi:predicted nucleic acid-binding Zn ribbon protein
VVDWKLESHHSHCGACRRPIQNARRDAHYCSNRCRQWHYRQRKRNRSAAPASAPA